MKILGDINRIQSKREKKNKDIVITASQVICKDLHLGETKFTGDNLKFSGAFESSSSSFFFTIRNIGDMEN